MNQKFYHNSLQTNYIKYLLQQVYIPTVPFTCNINHITKNSLYIHDNYFVKAKKSQDVVQLLKELKEDPTKYSEYFQKFDPYIFGRRYLGLTTNYISNTDTYDPETHYYLGQYLKAYKAYYGIDLFPYYNCFSDEYLDNISLIKSDSTPYVKFEEVANSNYKILSVPIDLCQEYTIAVDCPTEILITPVFVGKKGILKNLTNILISSLKVAPHEELHQKSNYVFNGCSFKKPIYYQSPCIPGVQDKAQLSLPQYNKYLRLLIRLPAINNSSIVVMQGHYSNLSEQQDRILNLSMEDVTEYINKVSEIDYFPNPNSSYIFSDGDHWLTHYGDPLSVVRYCPSSLYNFINKDDFSIPCLRISSSNNPFLNVSGNVVNKSENSLQIVQNGSEEFILNIFKIFNYKEIQLKGANAFIELDGVDIGESLNISKDKWSDTFYFQANDSLNIKLSPETYLEIISLNNYIKIQYDKILYNEDSKEYSIPYLVYGLKDTIWDLRDGRDSLPLNLNTQSHIKIKISNGERIVVENSVWTELISVSNLMTEDEYLNKYLYNNLSLLYLNDGVSYAYNSRLIEYLVGNAITKSDPYVKNISTTQNALSSIGNKNIMANGRWNSNIRIAAFKSANEYRNHLGFPNIKDINGFIDKDTEKAIQLWSSYKAKEDN